MLMQKLKEKKKERKEGRLRKEEREGGKSAYLLRMYL